MSTIESAFLFAGALPAATYFDDDKEDELAIRRLANMLYCRADWNWARNGEATLTHGWRPESGFIPHPYEGYDEGLLHFILGIGSPTFALPLKAMTRTARRINGSRSTAANCSTMDRYLGLAVFLIHASILVRSWYSVATSHTVRG